MTLPVIDSCDGCGACCQEQCSPPGYTTVLAGHWDDEDDIDRVRDLSSEARSSLDEYVERLRRNETTDHDPCCWYDSETKGCKFYDERPSICRDFERSTWACHEWRRTYRIEVS